MTEIFERGASITFSGVTVAFALSGNGVPAQAQAPDPRHFFVRRGDGWEVVNVEDLCAAAHVPLPWALTSSTFSTAYGEQLLSVARCLSRMGLPAAPQPLPTPGPASRWWVEREDTP